MTCFEIEGYRNLANAIVVRSVRDLEEQMVRHANNPKCRRINRKIAELEDFFLSDWFTFLSGLDGQYVLQLVQKQVEENLRQAENGRNNKLAEKFDAATEMTSVVKDAQDKG